MNPDENGSPRVWAGSDGQARASFELTAESVRFLGGGNGSNGASAPQQQAAQAQFPEDEIPF